MKKKIPPRARKSRLHLTREAVMTIRRGALTADRLVYLLAANRPIRYEKGRSRIVYIGTTKKGVRRVAGSVAYRAEELLQRRGFKEVEAYILTYGAKPGVKNMWSKLERATLFMFRYQYGDIPELNAQGKNIWEDDAFRYFNRGSLLRLLRTLEPGGGRR